jgi:transposase
MDAAREQQLLDLLAARDAQVELLEAENARVRRELDALRGRLDQVLRKVYGKSSETLDPAQLELLLDPDAAKKAPAAGGPAGAPAAEAPAPAPATRAKPRKRPGRDFSRLEVVEEVLVPGEVKANPEAWREMHRVTSELLDWTPPKLFVRRVVRPVFVPRDDPDGAPLKAPAPPSPRQGLDASPALLGHVVTAKFRWHQPFYRQEKKFLSETGVRLPRNTLCGWNAVAADTLEPLYKLTGARLRARDYLQADETQIDYLVPGRGKAARGFLWGIHGPAPPGTPGKGEVYFEWHTSRASVHLDSLLGAFRGTLQADAYRAYDTFAARRGDIVLTGCWAHVRRKFHEALQGGQVLAAGPLARIQQLYRVETELRGQGAGADRCRETRMERSLPVIDSLRGELVVLRARPEVLPRSPLGNAIDHALVIWERLRAYCFDGRLAIDNNGMENAIRGSALGKRNWLFIGRGDTGRRTAINYTMVENAARAGHDPAEWLTDVLTRLPSMTNRDDLTPLLPVFWQPPGKLRATAVAAP